MTTVSSRCDVCAGPAPFRVTVYVRYPTNPTIKKNLCRKHALETKDWYINSGLSVTLERNPS